MRRLAKTYAEGVQYRPGVDRKAVLRNELAQAEGRSEPSDFGETRTVHFTNSDLRARMEACRDDRRIKRTPENNALKVALVMEARAAGWSLGEIARPLWTSAAAVGHIITKAVAA